jgi:chromosome segregation ATPase
MASTGRDQKVKIWDAGGNAAGEMPALAEAGQEVAISVDGSHVVAGDWAGNVRLWTRANPADEKRLAPNPPTLEMALEAGRNRHAELVAMATAEATKLDGLKTTLDGFNKQIADQQSAIAMLDTEIQSGTAAAAQIQQAIDQLRAANTMASTDLAKIEQDIQSKLAVVNQTIAEKKQLESNIATLQSQKSSATDPASQDLANIDQQIANGLQAVLDKANTLMQLTSDQNVLGATKAQREKEIAEMAIAINGKTQELAAWMAKIQSWNTAKANAAAQIEALSKERDAAMGPLAAAQASVDAANANVASAAEWIQLLEQDFLRYQNMHTEFANRKSAMEQSVAQAQAEQEAAAASIRGMQPQIDEVATSMQSLEAQIAELQKRVAALQEQKQGLDSQRVALQQAMDSATGKLQQLQGDLDTLTSQQQLFEAAYKMP